MKLVNFQRKVRIMIGLSFVIIILSGCGEKQAVRQPSEDSLKVIDLNNNQEIAVIPIATTTIGFDIFGDSVVWSDLRNEPNGRTAAMSRIKASVLGTIHRKTIRTFIYMIFLQKKPSLLRQAC
ncbi:hypothetical protein EHS13_16230 [Paenibacillus psychroresistens]|uniref:Uncharacterized protein n=1 Tax=Paenibacillus psychroresistens TaxID=1778678 RepID=A0A6B8RKG3_9BACL|nr:hypothetical protein [Paenibacillus psychroresistens]QGQ96317.1 hypothetical protein EHS13_16230 [Paenibacillus psychroresistens]